MKIEYVTDPVIFPRLRCPKCRGRVRQFRHEPDRTENTILLSIEPVGYMVLGLGVLVGFFWQAIWLFVVVFAALLPWLYVHHLRRVEYSCARCNGIFKYEAVRRTAI